MPVSRIPSIGIYHPANSKASEIRLVKCKSTFIVVYNNGDDLQNVILNSNEEGDIFVPNSVIIEPR